MYLSEYQKITIDNFMGLWNRGSLDDVPIDHASDILNMAFARKREVLTRPSTGFSHQVPFDSPGVRMFEAAFSNSDLIPLVCDGIGNIWRLDNYTILLSVPGMIDFSALNMNNSVYIAPMVEPSQYNPYETVIWVWSNPAFPIRKAAGPRPDVSQMTVTSQAPGNVGPGWYGVAICYVYDTGYVTPPSLVDAQRTLYMPGGTSIVLQNVPAAPSGSVGYLVLVTQAQIDSIHAQQAALYEYQTFLDTLGNPTFVLNFFDTDLTILATNDPVNGNLFNAMPLLPTGGGYGSVALIKYHGRMIIIGPTVVYDITGNPVTVYDGRIFVSYPGAPENFDSVTGYLVIDSEFDGNIPRTGFELFGVLYITKAVGTYGTQDTGFQPNDPTNPWIVNIIDGGIGAYHHCVGTIVASQPSLSFNSTAFLANRNGLFLFNGNVQRPELSWKIRALWAQMTIGLEYLMRVTIDIYHDIFYVTLPLGPSNGYSLTVLACDFSLGLDSQNVRWSAYIFPWQVNDIVMASWPDPIAAPDYYYLRLLTTGTIYRLDGQSTFDQVWVNGQFSEAVAIPNYYQTAALIPGDVGSLNITRFVRYRMSGQGSMTTYLQDQGEHEVQFFSNVNPVNFPGNYADLGIQTNFTNEKVVVRFGMDGVSDYFRMARVDIFGKPRWPTRPNA